MKRIAKTIFLVVIFCISTYTAFAQCSCEPNLTLTEHSQRSDAIFVGRVVEAKKIQDDKTENYNVVIEFEVKQTWKQDLVKYVLVKEFEGSLDGFEPNTEWLLYATKDEEENFQIFRGCCSRTQLLSTADKQGDLKSFKKMGIKNKKIIGSDTKSENP